MTTEMQEFPDEGEIVVVTVTKIGDHGAYVSLDEYNSIQGFLHISEIAPGWVRNVRKYVTEGEKKVVLVKKIRKDKGEIDLSLRQISKDQQKKKNGRANITRQAAHISVLVVNTTCSKAFPLEVQGLTRK